MTERAVRESSSVATCIVSYAEARAAFARKLRDSALTSEEHNLVANAFDKDWNFYEIVPVEQGMVREAGKLAEQYVLRGFDAIHLAAALLKNEYVAQDLEFLAFDQDLNEAARRHLRLYK